MFPEGLSPSLRGAKRLFPRRTGRRCNRRLRGLEARQGGFWTSVSDPSESPPEGAESDRELGESGRHGLISELSNSKWANFFKMDTIFCSIGQFFGTPGFFKKGPQIFEDRNPNFPSRDFWGGGQNWKKVPYMPYSFFEKITFDGGSTCFGQNGQKWSKIIKNHHFRWLWAPWNFILSRISWRFCDFVEKVGRFFKKSSIFSFEIMDFCKNVNWFGLKWNSSRLMAGENGDFCRFLTDFDHFDQNTCYPRQKWFFRKKSRAQSRQNSVFHHPPPKIARRKIGVPIFKKWGSVFKILGGPRKCQNRGGFRKSEEHFFGRFWNRQFFPVWYIRLDTFTFGSDFSYVCRFLGAQKWRFWTHFFVDFDPKSDIFGKVGVFTHFWTP